MREFLDPGWESLDSAAPDGGFSVSNWIGAEAEVRGLDSAPIFRLYRVDVTREILIVLRKGCINKEELQNAKLLYDNCEQHGNKLYSQDSPLDCNKLSLAPSFRAQLWRFLSIESNCADMHLEEIERYHKRELFSRNSLAIVYHHAFYYHYGFSWKREKTFPYSAQEACRDFTDFSIKLEQTVESWLEASGYKRLALSS